MFEILPESKNDLLAVRASGKLSAEDYENVLMPKLNSLFASYPKLKLLIVFADDFSGWKGLNAAWDDTKIGLKHPNDFEKMALVGAPEWIIWGMKFYSLFVKGTLRDFPADGGFEAALDWLNSEDDKQLLPEESETGQTYKVHESVAVFKDALTLEDAIEKLEEAGIDRAAIALLSTQDAITTHLPHRFSKVRELEESPDLKETVFVTAEESAEGKAALIGLPLYIGATAGALSVVATGGVLALAIMSTVGGLLGGGIGVIAANTLGKKHAQKLEQQLKDGGLLLTVRLDDEAQRKQVEDILFQAGGKDVHTHDIERRWGNKDIPLHDFNPDPFLLKP